MNRTPNHDLDQLCINTARVLSVDMTEKANSGHPGLPLGAAPMAYTLWDRFLRHNPANPRWANRDRFILSAGHASEMLYSLLHLTGYNITLDDLQNFRQWGSKTTGHPEYDPDLGIEATTGPLGQGIAMAVGMALAEAHLAARFNRDGFPVVDHFTFVLASDGDLMKGSRRKQHLWQARCSWENLLFFMTIITCRLMPPPITSSPKTGPADSERSDGT